MLGELRIARTEDGVVPPTNPFAALVAAGLGKGAWHALASAILLLLASGIRHARPRGSLGESRRAFAEHVEATGALYAREHLAAFLASRADVPRERAAKLYARALRAKSGDELEGDELATLDELRQMGEKALGGVSRP
jgi:hypothetical protein